MDYPSPCIATEYTVHMRKFIFSTAISSAISSTNVTRKLRNFREARNNQETIEKLSGNYREVRNFREIIEKQ